MQKSADCHSFAPQMNQLDSFGFNSFLSIFNLLPQLKVIVLNRILILFFHHPFFLLHLIPFFLLQTDETTLQPSTLEKFEATISSLNHNISSKHDIDGIINSSFGVRNKEVEISFAIPNTLLFVFMPEEVYRGLPDGWKILINHLMSIICSDCYFIYDITQNLNWYAWVVNQHTLDVTGDCLQVRPYIRSWFSCFPGVPEINHIFNWFRLIHVFKVPLIKFFEEESLREVICMLTGCVQFLGLVADGLGDGIKLLHNGLRPKYEGCAARVENLVRELQVLFWRRRHLDSMAGLLG